MATSPEVSSPGPGERLACLFDYEQKDDNQKKISSLWLIAGDTLNFVLLAEFSKKGRRISLRTKVIRKKVTEPY